MAIYARYSNTSYAHYTGTSKLTTPSLCTRKNNTTYYTPLVKGNWVAVTRISGSTCYIVKPTNTHSIFARYNNTTYEACKNSELSRTFITLSSSSTVTSASNFRTIILQNFALNQVYNLVEAITIYTSNGGTNSKRITFPAGTPVKLADGYMGGSYTLCFGDNYHVGSINWDSEDSASINLGAKSGASTAMPNPFHNWASTTLIITGAFKIVTH